MTFINPIVLCLTYFLLNDGRGINAQFDISNSINEFSIDLLKTTSQNVDKNSNLAMSAYTVWTILANIDEGAGGETKRQIESALRIANVDKMLFRRSYQNLTTYLAKTGQDVTLDISNTIFTTDKQKLRNDFALVSQKTYGVDVTPINFQDPDAANKINNIISKNTRRRIKKFIGSGDLADAQIFIASVLFFKGAWATPFKSEQTKSEPFFDENDNKIANVQMMHIKTFLPFTRIENFRSLAVELPYGDGDKMSMVVLLPFRGETVNSVLAKITHFGDVLRLLDEAKDEFEGDDVEVALPRFALRCDLSLNAILDLIGVKDLFNMETADLLGIFPHYLYVSRLMQSAIIDVNEEGTVAAAVAGATIINKSPPPKFVANKPFLYFIVNKMTKTIVFSGKVSNPVA